ncbi:TerB family tellurite resistance protein [Pelagibacterales bacterium SAG-MED05]|nr:TerB family tellurite resistance protein [Pelagibacterales bacterium SAG-MED05]
MKTLDQKSIIGIAALLINAAKIDEQYSDHEKILIKEFIKSYLKNINYDEILKKAEEIEHNSNQLLNFTNLIKKNTIEVKSDIIEHLWKIIISDNKIDQYESNLMRRICGLIYFPDKMCAEIKLRLLNNK